jgi:putative peptidoglycan lipid II flippase
MDAELQANSATQPRRRLFSRAGLIGDLFTVGSLATLVKLIGAVKVAVTARFFGANSELDAYLIAFLLPSLFADVFSGSISSALVPAFLRTQSEEGREAAQSLYRKVLTASTVLLGAIAILLGLIFYVIQPLLAPRAGRFELIRPLLFVLLPVLPLSAMSVTWRAVLNAHGRFWVAAAIPSITPLFSIALLFAATNHWGVYVLAMGTVGGNLVEAALLAIAVRQLGYSIAPQWNPAAITELRDVAGQYVPMVAGALVLGGSTFIDQGFATLLGTGGIAILTYGTKLTRVLLALGPAALGTAILPYLSRMAAEGNWTGIRKATRRFVLVICAVTIPVTLMLIAFSEPLVRIYLQRGLFSAEITKEVARVQQFSLIQIPIAVTLALAMGLTASLRANRLFFRVALLGLVLNAISDFVLMKYLGAAGIAASDAIAGLAMLGYLSLLLNRRLRQAARQV